MAGDYGWFSQVGDLSKGFCFVWVLGVRPVQVLERMGADELERIGWQQLVGAGDGQRGVTDKRYFGVSRISDDWSLVVEDNGSLGRADELLRPLSVGTKVVVVHRDADGRGRFLLLEDQSVRLDFDPMSDGPRAGAAAAALNPTVEASGFDGAAEPARRTAAAFALAERLTGVRLDLEVLRGRTYLFSVVPAPL
ncbi:DUF6461 domain-containing protein [Actinoplanes solisilvae]|uniref:DUF6461 domain-containing protein n=1 Tax=Actinoplanes solisilvae TaxID=2486853 RepID=UPI001F0CCE16|nr:DUF6461 domain-containing protein [Actinoplanes solisilvae]